MSYPRISQIVRHLKTYRITCTTHKQKRFIGAAAKRAGPEEGEEMKPSLHLLAAALSTLQASPFSPQFNLGKTCLKTPMEKASRRILYAF
jgi:hypothetical protein